MRLDKRMTDIKQALPLEVGSEHFKVRHGIRDSGRYGRGLGIRGVRDPLLISSYIEALERLYDTITGPLFNWPTPKVDDSGKTAVFVFHIADMFSDGSPFTTLDLDGVPYLGLSCRHWEPTLRGAFDRASSEAVHEATHVFNFSARPPALSFNAREWLWFNEATALFMEGQVMAGNSDCLRYYLHWTDCPDVPLDHPDGFAPYSTGLFAAYLVRRFGPSFLGELWTKSTPLETPLAAICRLKPTVGSPHAHLFPLFADYAVDGYFLWDHTSAAFQPAVFQRFGRRAVSECCSVSCGQTVSLPPERIDHLACRYYRIDLHDNVSGLRFKVTRPSSAEPNLNIRATVVTSARTRGASVEFAADPARPSVFAGELGSLVPAKIEYVVITVANCGMRRFVNHQLPHDDRQEYSISVEAT